MPISEDEYDHQNGNNVPQQSGMSKAELRRSNKPIMEKRRRARINHCLNELKTLILDALKKDPARHSKLEKADILEMTVKHLQNIQRQQAVLQTADAGVLHRFRSGFSECAGEVSRCISGMEGVDPGVRQRLVAHLSTCVQQMNPFQPLGAHTPSNPPILPTSFAVAGDVNNNGNNDRIQIPSGIQLIPSRLPTGELALLLPNSSNMPFFSTSSSSIIADSSSQQKPESSVSSTKPGHLSAFTTVTRSQSPKMLRPKTSSPPLSPASSTTSFGDDYKISSPSPNISGQVVITTPYSAQYTQTYTFKNVPQKAEQKQQQPQVTSTSVLPDKNIEQSSEMKISYQSVPIYQHTEKPRVWNSSQNLDHEKPLSVITSDKYKVPYTPQDKEYYSRKRHYRESETESLLIVASPKVPKYSPDIVSSSQRSLPSMGSPENVANKSSDSLESLSFKSSPSTSSSANTSASSSGSNESMWRPW